jgi:prephenate dehydratase
VRNKPNSKSEGKIAVLGPAGTFSDIAAEKYLSKNGLKMSKVFTKDIDECFNLIENGKIPLALVPIENKLNGTVRETLDNLFSRKVNIVDEISLPIHHYLVGLKNAKISDIKTVSSHSQAIHQCKKFLNKKLKRVNFESMESTAFALQKLMNSKDKTMAVIASKDAALKSGLKILAEKIENEQWNSTNFLVIQKGDYVARKPTQSVQKISSSRPMRRPSRPIKTSICFYFKKDQPGSLFSVFKIFANAKINLSKIESRPSKSSHGGYIFFLDLSGSANDKKVKSALKSIQKSVAFLKIFGSY